jgi:hypothetical protein
MPSLSEIEQAVRECLKDVPFEHADNLDAPFNDFWKKIDEQDDRTDRGIHRVDLFLGCLETKLKISIIVSRDDLLQGKLKTPGDVAREIDG